MSDKARYQNYIVLDFETGGLNPEKSAITQFACIILDGLTLKEINRYSTFVQNSFDLELSDNALEYTGITLKDIEGGIPEKQLVEELISLFKEGRCSNHKAYRPIVVAQNATFDMGFISALFKRNKQDVFKSVDEIPFCTMKLDKAGVTNESGEIKYGLEAICDRIGIELVDGHDALNDVKATVDAFIHYMMKLRGDGGEYVMGSSEEKKRVEVIFEI